jgi:hypothetical protein
MWKYEVHTVDTIMYAIAKNKLTKVNGDKHFKDSPNVEMI